jgi:hypothetical protein
MNKRKRLDTEKRGEREREACTLTKNKKQKSKASLPGKNMFKIGGSRV